MAVPGPDEAPAVLIRQQLAIADLSQMALDGMGLDALLDEAVGVVASTLGVEHAKVLELLPSGDLLSLRAGVGWKPGLVGHATVPAERHSQAGFTLLSGEPVVVEDLRTETRFDGPSLLLDHGIVSGLSVAIPLERGIYGVLGVHATRRRPFSHHDVHFLRVVANVLGAAIERARADEALRRGEARYRALFETALDAVFVVDEDARFVDVNPQASLVTGCSREELLRMTVFDLTAPEDRVAGQEMFREFVRVGRMKGKYQLLRKDGRQVDVEYSAVKVEPGRYQSIVRDVTERNRVGRLREEFLNLAAHELRTPLTAIKGYTQLLLNRGTLDGRDWQNLLRMKSQSDRLSHLVQTLLDVVQLQDGGLKLRKARLSLGVLASRTVREHLADAEHRTIRVDVDPGAFVDADGQRLRAVVYHLVDNALKYSPPGGLVEVRVCRRGQEAEVTVRDQGRGIPREKQSAIFGAYYQVAPMVAPASGLGLGLYICGEIIRIHGGRIWVQSEEGQGSTFGFALPIAA